jgi:hypothetical protein
LIYYFAQQSPAPSGVGLFLWSKIVCTAITGQKALLTLPLVGGLPGGVLYFGISKGEKPLLTKSRAYYA